MGGIIAKNQPSLPIEKSKEEIVKLVLPVYYTEEPITSRDQQLITASWNMVVHDTAPEYLEEKKNAHFKFESCLYYFSHLFFSRLFRIHSEAKPLFQHSLSNEAQQVKVLTKMVSLFLLVMENESEQSQTLVKLAEQHYSMGVKAVQCKLCELFSLSSFTLTLIRLSCLDGVFGEMLFYALQGTIGFDYYSFEVHQAWVRVYSLILKRMIPVAVGCECQEFQSAIPFTIKDLEKKDVNSISRSDYHS